MADQLKVEWDGRTYSLDIKQVDVRQAMNILNIHGLTVKAYNEGIVQLDPRSQQALMWLMLDQNGVKTNMRDLNFDIFEFMDAINTAKEQYDADQTLACTFCDEDGKIVHANGNLEPCTHDPKVEGETKPKPRSTGSRPKIS